MVAATGSPGSPVSEVVLLEPDGNVADAAIDIACEYAEALFDNSSDPARTWLPSWTWQRREQVERSVYEGLIAKGDQRAYEATRRFLIEHPVGDARSLVQLRNEAGARNVAEYSPIGPDRIWQGHGSAYWWPCPVCRWPMRVKPPLVACAFRHHDARFRLVTPARHDDRPRLVALTVKRLSPPVAVSADGSVCLAPSVWRHVTVPGISELATEMALKEIEGVHVEMWLGLDAIDLLVQVGGRKLEVDVKDRVDPIMIAEDAPTAQHIVVPDYRRAELPVLRDLLPDKHVWTIREFVKYPQAGRHPAMTPGGKGSTDRDGLRFVVGGALGLAAHFFPRQGDDGRTCGHLDDARYFLSGHMEVWSRWPSLHQDDRARITRLLRFRPVEVANRNVFARLVQEFVPHKVAGFRLNDDGHLLVDLGRPALEYVDECLVALQGEREMRPRAAATIAGSGVFGTPLYLPGERGSGSRTVNVQYQLNLLEEDVAGEPPTALGPAADADAVDIPVAELRHLAVRLDTAFGHVHRLESVDRIFQYLQTFPGEEVVDIWTLRAGPTRILHAPTGVGKNVLAELVACWCVEHERVASLVVPTNAVVVATAYSIERSLRALGRGDEVAH